MKIVRNTCSISYNVIHNFQNTTFLVDVNNSGYFILKPLSEAVGNKIVWMISFSAMKTLMGEQCYLRHQNLRVLLKKSNLREIFLFKTRKKTEFFFWGGDELELDE